MAARCRTKDLQRLQDRAPPARRIAGKLAPTSVSGQLLLQSHHCPPCWSDAVSAWALSPLHMTQDMHQGRRRYFHRNNWPETNCGSWLASDAPRGRRSILRALHQYRHAPGRPHATPRQAPGCSGINYVRYVTFWRPSTPRISATTCAVAASIAPSLRHNTQPLSATARSNAWVQATCSSSL